MNEQFPARSLEKRSPAVEALYANTFEGVPKEFVSVFHYTSVENIENIAQNGLRSIAKANWQGTTDKIFDSVAPHGLSRSTAVYAALPSNTEWRDMKHHGLKLELKVNPARAYVVDGSIYTDGLGAHMEPELHRKLGRKDVEGYAREYWARAVPLKEFLASHPAHDVSEEHEVLIPYVVAPQYIRAYKQ